METPVGVGASDQPLIVSLMVVSTSAAQDSGWKRRQSTGDVGTNGSEVSTSAAQDSGWKLPLPQNLPMRQKMHVSTSAAQDSGWKPTQASAADGQARSRLPSLDFRRAG